MSLTTVDEAASQILKRGGAPCWQRLTLSMHTDIDVGMEWNSTTFVDTVLPFGLRSAPKIFSSIADALECILLEKKGGPYLSITWMIF